MSRFAHRSNVIHCGILLLFFVLSGLAVSVGCNQDKIDRSKFQAAQDEDGSQTKRIDRGTGDGTDGGILTPDNLADSENTGAAKKSDGQLPDDSGIVAVGSVSKKSKGTLPTSDQFGSGGKTGDGQVVGKSANTASVKKTSESTGTNYFVPDGTNEVLAFLRRTDLKLAELIRDEEKNKDELIKIHQARMEAAEKILHVDELRRQAVEIKLEAMTMMSLMGKENMLEAALEYSAEIAKSENPDIADFGLMSLLDSDYRAMTAEPNDETTNRFMNHLQTLVEKRGDSSIVQGMIVSRIGQLFQPEMREIKMRALQVAADGFKSSKIPDTIENGKLLAEHLFVTRAGFDLAGSSFSKDDPASVERLVEATEKVLQNPDMGAVTLSELRRRTLYLESIHAYDCAERIYELMEKAFKEHNTTIGKEGQRLGRNGSTRVALVGKPLEVEGYTMLKQELDWSLFKNKVVILNFWSTGNQLCVPNLAEMQQFVKANESKAIKLVAVNVDEDPNAIVAMFTGRNPPWTNLVTNDLTKLGWESPMAVKCGIDFVPYTLLIDQAGKVADIDVLGADLEQRVANLLGEELTGSDGKAIQPASQEKRENQNDAAEAKLEVKKSADNQQPIEAKN